MNYYLSIPGIRELFYLPPPTKKIIYATTAAAWWMRGSARPTQPPKPPDGLRRGWGMGQQLVVSPRQEDEPGPGCRYGRAHPLHCSPLLQSLEGEAPPVRGTPAARPGLALHHGWPCHCRPGCPTPLGGAHRRPASTVAWFQLG